MPDILPTLPNRVQGIIAVRTNKKGRPVYTLQCQHCGNTEEPELLVLMEFKFCPRHDPKYGHDRLCPTCRFKSLVSQGWSEAQARRIIEEGNPS